MHTLYVCIHVYTCMYIRVLSQKNNSVRLRRVWESSDIVLKLNHLRERLVA